MVAERPALLFEPVLRVIRACLEKSEQLASTIGVDGTLARVGAGAYHESMSAQRRSGTSCARRRARTGALAPALGALLLAGCGQSAHSRSGAAGRHPSNPAVARLRICLTGHGKLSATGHGESFGRPTSASSFDYGAVAVSVYPTVAAAKASIAAQPSLGSQIRTGAVVVEFGDALHGGEFRDAAQVRACVRQADH